MNAKELREALDWLDNYNWHGGPSIFYEERLRRHESVADAARTIALPILEADPELVERIAEALFHWREGKLADWHLAKAHHDHLRSQARTVLAAISTPT